MTAGRTRCAALLLAALLALFAHHAQAQSCHPVALTEPTQTGFHAGFTSVIATFSDAEHGTYQGVIPTLSWYHPRVAAEVALPWYRLERNGDEELGLGDALADVRVAVFRTSDGEFSLGPELAVSLPTGRSSDELGMGHVMMMPGVWLRLAWRDLSVMGQLAYGRALADTGVHTHHHEAGAVAHAVPRVSPMNMSEIEHALGIRYALDPNIAVTARWAGGVPLEDSGLARQVLGPGVQLMADALDAAIEVLVPVAGDPFDLRLSISIGARF